MFDPTSIPLDLNDKVTSWLVYDRTKPMPDAAMLDMYNPFDDFTLVPQDGMQLYDKVDQTITLNFQMANLGDGVK